MNIGIAGFGHLGKVLVKGLLCDDFVSRENIFVTAKSEATRDIAVNEYKLNACCSNSELIEKSDIIFISLPPNVFINDFGSCGIYGNKKFISLMAGVTTEQLKNVLGENQIIRAMPNLGIEKTEGIICYTDTDDKEIIKIFDHLGYSFKISEADIEKVTAFASCGVGFAAYILNCFLSAGENLGFSTDASKKIVHNIFYNALQSSDYNKLVSSVATKGGATEAGINSFEEDKIKETIYNAVYSAYKRMM